MERRAFLASTAAALAAPRLAAAQSGPGSRVLRFVPESDATVLDPVWTTATVTRNHGYLVFDTLYGQADDFSVQPQMVEGHVVEEDGLRWTLTLREGLRFHDGEPVRGVDCIASIRRIAARDAFTAALMAATEELSAPTDRTIVFRLKKRFPLLPNALGKTGTSMPAIMPERLAKTDPGTRVTEMVGSGPFRYLAREHVDGAFSAYGRFEGYKPREGGPASFTAGPKTVHFDRIEWRIIPDPATAAGALMNGEVDWWQQAAIDLMPMLSRGNRFSSMVQDVSGNLGTLRFNHLLPPFDNAAIRRALLGAISQADCMQAIAGNDASLWKDGVGPFPPGTPLANSAGLEVISGRRDYDKVKRDLAAAGYKGEPVVMMVAGDYPAQSAMGLVAADALKRGGLNVDLQVLDWGTVVQRRAKKDAPQAGGWNLFITFLTGTNNFDPASHLGLRGNGAGAWFGWPTLPRLEALRQDWFDAPDLAAQKQVGEAIQRQFWEDVPYLPLGVYYQPTIFSRRLTGLRSGFPQFYDVRWS
ncbi:ABC transporter substrate-binding protein [Pseudoroseomonas deserti]|uniref:ABC transporter substrate-binding protein n=1 Tax=Teichococcus deserti TaxID=1817963 RepID=A0A1V2H815_9PROT|nr:ABC transporter substrate-binding protein [Pseudoroseomonas deserti]ONG57019.1 ABC transporter substrate-binding protein [Pseudoroseomonas deserti]